MPVVAAAQSKVLQRRPWQTRTHIQKPPQHFQSQVCASVFDGRSIITVLTCHQLQTRAAHGAPIKSPAAGRQSKFLIPVQAAVTCGPLEKSTSLPSQPQGPESVCNQHFLSQGMKRPNPELGGRGAPSGSRLCTLEGSQQTVLPASLPLGQCLER